MYYVYILKSIKDDSFYIGQTKDIGLRLVRHNLGHGKFTRSRKPYKIVMYEKFPTRSDALKREREIKSYKGGQQFKKLIKPLG